MRCQKGFCPSSARSKRLCSIQYSLFLLILVVVVGGVVVVVVDIVVVVVVVVAAAAVIVAVTTVMNLYKTSTAHQWQAKLIMWIAQRVLRCCLRRSCLDRICLRLPHAKAQVWGVQDLVLRPQQTPLAESSKVGFLLKAYR